MSAPVDTVGAVSSPPNKENGEHESNVNPRESSTTTGNKAGGELEAKKLSEMNASPPPPPPLPPPKIASPMVLKAPKKAPSGGVAKRTVVRSATPKQKLNVTTVIVPSNSDAALRNSAGATTNTKEDQPAAPYPTRLWRWSL